MKTKYLFSEISHLWSKYWYHLMIRSDKWNGWTLEHRLTYTIYTHTHISDTFFLNVYVNTYMRIKLELLSLPSFQNDQNSCSSKHFESYRIILWHFDFDYQYTISVTHTMQPLKCCLSTITKRPSESPLDYHNLPKDNYYNLNPDIGKRVFASPVRPRLLITALYKHLGRWGDLRFRLLYLMVGV